ncbi:MAG: adenylyltransferase/cytidyltransferase family protein [Bacteroidales bacterium]
MGESRMINNFDELKSLAPCKIGFLGGSFNPVHSGHIALVEHVLEKYLNYAVFCPHSLHPDKKSILIPIYHRINMISILAKHSACSDRIFIVNPAFIEGTYNSSFVNLCLALKDNGVWPSIICGIDCFSRASHPEIFQFDHYVGIRNASFEEEKIRQRVTGNIVFFETQFTTLSSTGIRAGIALNSHELHQEIKKYIADNSLFQNIEG